MSNMSDSNSSVAKERLKENARPSSDSNASTTESTPSAEGRLGWRELFWVPYAGLTIILITLACGSFYMYHRKNRDRYRDAAYKVKHNIYSSPKKYRVTLNRNGYVGCLLQMRQGAVNTAGVDNVTERNALSRIRVTNAMPMSDIFTVTPMVSNEQAEHAPYIGPEVKTYSYENEGYDAESSQGSDKSLLKRRESAGETHFTHGDISNTVKKREYWFDKYRVKSTGAKRKAAHSEVQIEPNTVDTPPKHDQLVHRPTSEDDVISSAFVEPQEKGQKRRRRSRKKAGTSPNPPANHASENSTEHQGNIAHMSMSAEAI